MTSRTMRAATFDRHGGPEVVEITEVPVPEPGPGEVRLAVRAAAMNHLDLWIRRGLPIETPMPHIGGSDVAGIVDAVGGGVPAELVGRRVVVDPSLDYDWYEPTPVARALPTGPFRILGEHTQGGFAEFALAPAANLVEVPEEVALTTAAAAALTFVTAWRALITRAGLRPGESVLVTGASGGVSSAAIQIARLTGATVYGVTSGVENMARVKGLGADVVYDRLEQDWGKALWEDTGRRGVDVALDSVGEAVWPAVLRSLAVGGRLVTFGATTGARGMTEIRTVFWKQLSILGTTMGNPAEFRTVMDLVFRDLLRPAIHAVLPLEEARKAHELLESGQVFGKVVLRP